MGIITVIDKREVTLKLGDRDKLILSNDGEKGKNRPDGENILIKLQILTSVKEITAHVYAADLLDMLIELFPGKVAYQFETDKDEVDVDD